MEEVIESETESSDFDEMRKRVLETVGKYALVIGLPATTPIRRSVCARCGKLISTHKLTMPDTAEKLIMPDKAHELSMSDTARKLYMERWYANVKLKRLAAREAARVTPRRSPRLALKRD